jgi:hypothetical protein
MTLNSLTSSSFSLLLLLLLHPPPPPPPQVRTAIITLHLSPYEPNN